MNYKDSTLLITAAGHGKRFGMPKFKAVLDHQPMILKTISAFSEQTFFKQCLVTISREDFQELKQLLENKYWPFPVQIVIGGETRAISVKNAVDLVHTEFVWIHDGARPFVSQALIHRLYHASRIHDAVIPVIDEVDTLKEVKEGYVLRTVERNVFKRVQTPQVFKTHCLKEAYQSFFNKSQTDESGLVEKTKVPVYVVEGEINNKKITFQTDIA